MKYILTIILGVLLGDCIAICIRQLEIGLRIRGSGIKISKSCTEMFKGRLERTYAILIKRDLECLAVEAVISSSLMFIMCMKSWDGKVSIASITLLVGSIVATVAFRVLRIIKKQYAVKTVLDMLILGFKVDLILKSEEYKGTKDKKIIKQMGVCNSNIETIYSIMDRIRTKKDYEESPELKSNISKLESDLSLLQDMLSS